MSKMQACLTGESGLTIPLYLADNPVLGFADLDGGNEIEFRTTETNMPLNLATHYERYVVERLGKKALCFELNVGWFHYRWHFQHLLKI